MRHDSALVDSSSVPGNCIHDLTDDELHSIRGGDLFEIAWGTALALAGAGGLLGAPALAGVALVVAGMTIFER